LFDKTTATVAAMASSAGEQIDDLFGSRIGTMIGSLEAFGGEAVGVVKSIPLQQTVSLELAKLPGAVAFRSVR
jgi:hypothetical protein